MEILKRTGWRQHISRTVFWQLENVEKLLTTKDTKEHKGAHVRHASFSGLITVFRQLQETRPLTTKDTKEHKGAASDMLHFRNPLLFFDSYKKRPEKDLREPSCPLWLKAFGNQQKVISQAAVLPVSPSKQRYY